MAERKHPDAVTRSGLLGGAIQALLDASSESMILLDLSGTILAINEIAALRLGGAPAATLVGRCISDFYAPEVWSLRALKRSELITSKQPVVYESARDGRLYIVTGHPVLGEDGEVVQIAIFGRDVTEQRRQEQSLVESEARYRDIYEGSPMGIVQISLDGTRGLIANKAMQRMLGYDSYEEAQALVKDVARDVYADPTERERLLQTLADSGGVAKDFEARLKRKDGTIVWVSLSVRAVPGADGRVAYVEGFCLDINARKEAEATLQATVEALRLAVEEKTEYRRNLETVFHGLPDALVLVDENMRIMEMNRPFRRLCELGYRTSAQFLAKPGDTLPCPCRDQLRRTLESNSPFRGVRVKCLRGEAYRTLLLDSIPVARGASGFAGALLMVKDVSRLDHLERRLSERTHYQGMIGRSDKIQEVYSILEKLTGVETTVLVTGESGTGKELVAEALHYGGSRSSGPLIKVNCTALSESLLESELFGHVRGAFTGAIQERIGCFQAADNGTILLDEIGDISPRLQLNLLRVIESKEFQRVGDTRTYRANVRIVTATNADLMLKVRQGTFREDLYYRLKVVTINLPPLRSRKEDLPMLVDHFLEIFAKGLGKGVDGVTDETLEIFMRHDWPGNIRELRHAVEHACILCRGGLIGPEHLPREVFSGLSEKRPMGDRSRGSERERVLEALTQAEGNRARAARLLGISRQTLYRRLGQWGLEQKKG